MNGVPGGIHSQALDRRRSERHLTILRVGKVTRTEGEELCMVRNISAGGAQAHVAGGFAVDELVTLDLRFDERIEANVVWVFGNEVGLKFKTPVDVSDLLSAPAVGHFRPRAPRIRVPSAGRLKIGKHWHDVSTTDISQGGARIAAGVTLASGSPVVLSLGGLPDLTGIVRWTDDTTAGLSLNQPVALWKLMDWVRTLRKPVTPDEATASQRQQATR